MVQVAVASQQHGLIAMTKDLRGHANTDTFLSSDAATQWRMSCIRKSGRRSMPVKLDHFFL
jgi:hypothetical protein